MQTQVLMIIWTFLISGDPMFVSNVAVSQTQMMVPAGLCERVKRDASQVGMFGSNTNAKITVLCVAEPKTP